MSYIQGSTIFPKENFVFVSNKKEKGRRVFTKRAFCDIICVAIELKEITMKFSYKSTILACYNGYITQAICINLAPLLYLTFQREFSLSVSQVGLLIAVNFATQILVDVIASHYANRLNLRVMAILAHVLAAGGLVGLAIFPKIMPPFLGLLLAEGILGCGGGFTEVIISPLMEACPTEEKSGNMSLLHSFYSWGQAGVVLLSGIYFYCFEISKVWYYLPILWAIIPLIGAVAFSIVPIYNLPTKEGEKSAVGRLFRTPLFLVFFLMMFCAGAGEMIMSQWASAFVESALGINKTLGDLLGPCMFAVMMGIARVLYGRLSGKIDLTKWMTWGCIGCSAAYLLAAFAPHPILALLGCALCGFSVGVFWPGTLSHAAANIPLGGVSMFAILAVAGDIGCLSGPYLSGVIADAFGQNLRASFVFATVFPIICLVVLWLQKRKKNKVSN